MRVIIRSRSTLREILNFPKPKNAPRGAGPSHGAPRSCEARRTHWIFLLLFSSLTIAFASSDLTISTTPGMSWNYSMTQEVGEGVGFSDLKADPDGKFRAAVTYRLDGTEKVNGKDLLKFEMHRAGAVTNTDLITVDERGIVCVARIGLEGKIVKLDPPQIIVAAPLKTGTTWDFDGKLNDAKVHQHYSVTGEEDIDVPAGKFRAFHIHGEQTSPSSMTIDRWFANGVGIVKDVTETRTTSDKVLRRISLELNEQPKSVSRPEVKPLTATLGRQPIGEAAVNFAANTRKIYARWQGHGLPDRVKIRAAWIAENIGDDAPPDYKIDEATVTATAPNSHGIFTLSRPEEGWTPGDYRVEFYVNDELTETVTLKIAK
jgi:hypothetical protein